MVISQVSVTVLVSIDKAHRARKPLRDYDPECDQLKCYEELAQIVENGGVMR